MKRTEEEGDIIKISPVFFDLIFDLSYYLQTVLIFAG